MCKTAATSCETPLTFDHIPIDLTQIDNVVLNDKFKSSQVLNVALVDLLHIIHI